MLYFLLYEKLSPLISGFRVFRYVTSRTAFASLTALFLCIALGPWLIGKLRQVKATGRIVLEFKSNSASLDSIPAMSLEDGDIFVIPSVPSSVSVVGAVYNQSAFLYQKERHAGNYLHMAGGPNRTADFKRSFIIRADGSVVGRVAAGGPWSSSFKDLSMHPGDSIVIPEKIYNPASMSGLINAVTMFSQLAVGGGTVGYLLTR